MTNLTVKYIDIYDTDKVKEVEKMKNEQTRTKFLGAVQRMPKRGLGHSATYDPYPYIELPLPSEFYAQSKLAARIKRRVATTLKGEHDDFMDDDQEQPDAEPDTRTTIDRSIQVIGAAID